MNLLEMFKELNKDEKREFVNLIKKEIQTEITVNIPKDFNFVDYQKKLSQKKFQLFGQ